MESYDKLLTNNLKIGSNKNPLPAGESEKEDNRYQWQKDLADSDFMKKWGEKVKGWEEEVAKANKVTENWCHIEVLDKVFNIVGSSYKDAFAAFEMLSKGGQEFETRVNNRVRRSMALQPDDTIKGVFASYSVKKLAEGLFFTKFPGTDKVAKPNENGEFNIKGKEIPKDVRPKERSKERPEFETLVYEPKDFESLDVGNDRKPFFDNSIVDLLPSSFLEMSFSQCISTIAEKDPSLTNCQFILYRKNNQGKPEVFNFRIKNWQVPEEERKVGNLKYGNGVMSVAINRYSTHKTLIDMDIILDRQLKTLRHIMEAVGIGTIEGDFLNLSEGFDNQYSDLGTVYLQIVPGWYLTTEQNLGSPGSVYDNLKKVPEIIDSKTGEPVKGNPLKYPLFCFTNVKLRTLDLPLKFNTKENGKAWTVKVQASYEKLYKTSDEVKEGLLKATVVDPKLAFTKYGSN